MPKLTLAQARLQLQLGPTDPRVRPRYEPQQADYNNRVPTTVAIGVGTHTAEGLKQAAYDKRTGEWKSRLWGGRKEIVTDDGTTLYDHHLDKDGKRMGRRKQESNWFLTVNTNKRKFEYQDASAVHDALDVVFKKRLYQVLTFGPKQPDTYSRDAQWPDAVIEHVGVSGGVERGPITGALHAHMHLRVVHWSQLWINVPALQVAFKQEYNMRASAKIKDTAMPSVKVELLQQSDFSQILAMYLAKQQTG
jgi:hypothetical protein